jgi:hypothetical protein
LKTLALADEIWLKRALRRATGPRTPANAEDYEFHDPPNFPDPREVRGRDAVAAHLKDQTSVLGDLKVTIVDVRARDETVVVRLEGTAHGAESGVDVPAEATQVFEVAAGRLQRARMFLTWEEALEAAGLSE